MAKVIILNGISSAGKTTLAKALQSQASEALLHVALDDFISMLPDSLEHGSQWFPIGETCDGETKLPIIGTGRRGASLLSTMRSLVAHLASNGLDIVVDDVCEKSEIDDYRQRLADIPLRVVKVDAPIEIIEAREKERGDRLIGLARAQSLQLHAGIEYDLLVDTHNYSVTDNAAKILSSF